MTATTTSPPSPSVAGSSVDSQRRLAPGSGVGPPGSRPAVEVHDLRKAYGRDEVLTGLTLSVEQGQIFGLLGSNGAGKTTAVEIVQGLRARDGGQVRVLGLDPATERPRLRHLVGAQLQSSALPDRLRVGEALRLFARLAGDVFDWRQLRDEWQLGSLERRAFGALSGGERQRLFLALALVNRPRLVFLDELTQGLDAAARRATWRLIERVRDEGATVVLVTHFMDEAERLCDQVGVLHEGRIVTSGRPADLVTATGGPVHIRFTVAVANPPKLAPEVPDSGAFGASYGPNAAAVVGAAAPGTVTSTVAQLVEGLEQHPGVHTISLQRAMTDLAVDATACMAVIAELHRRGVKSHDLAVVRPTLEDAFVALTGGEVR